MSEGGVFVGDYPEGRVVSPEQSKHQGLVNKAKERLKGVGGSILDAMRLGRSSSPSDILVSLVTVDENTPLKSNIKDGMAMSQLEMIGHRFRYLRGQERTASVFETFAELVRVNGSSEGGFMISKVIEGMQGLNQMALNEGKTEVNLFDSKRG